MSSLTPSPISAFAPFRIVTLPEPGADGSELRMKIKVIKLEEMIAAAKKLPGEWPEQETREKAIGALDMEGLEHDLKLAMPVVRDVILASCLEPRVSFSADGSTEDGEIHWDWLSMTNRTALFTSSLEASGFRGGAGAKTKSDDDRKQRGSGDRVGDLGDDEGHGDPIGDPHGVSPGA